MQQFIDWLSNMEWHRVVPEIVGKATGFLLGFAASWFLLFRRRLREIQRFQQGDSDDVLFQFHKLVPLDKGEVALLFRNIGPKTTVNKLYDNPAARELLKSIADRTTLGDPILATEGTGGYEVLNDAFGYIAGHIALSPFPREAWLFIMTCEDRHVVRKKCVRCFLVRAEDLAKFEDWAWCRSKVRLERPWHWFRIVALHQIAKQWRGEQTLSRRERAAGESATAMPLVDRQVRHNRVKELSAGLFGEEKPVGETVKIDWAAHMSELKKLGLPLE
jgi:hypothetical protein